VVTGVGVSINTVVLTRGVFWLASASLVLVGCLGWLLGSGGLLVYALQILEWCL